MSRKPVDLNGAHQVVRHISVVSSRRMLYELAAQMNASDVRGPASIAPEREDLAGTCGWGHACQVQYRMYGDMGESRNMDSASGSCSVRHLLVC